MVEISAFPANTSVGTTTSIVTCNGTGTGGSLLSSGLVLKEALAESAAGTSIAGTNTILADIGGTPTLVPVSALPSGGAALVLSQGTTTLTPSTLALSTGLTLSGSGTLATLTASGGSGGLTLEQGTTTLAAAGTLVLSTGITLTGSGSTGTLTASGGGGSGIANSPDFGTLYSSGAFSRPAGSSLTWINQGAAAYTDVTGGPLILHDEGDIGQGTDFRILAEACPVTSSWTRTWYFSYQLNAAGSFGLGVCLIDTAGKLYNYILTYNGSTLDLWVFRSNSVSNIQNSAFSSIFQGQKSVFLQISCDGTNYYFRWSANGYYFTTFWQAAVSDWLGTLQYTGIFVNPQGSNFYEGGPVFELWNETTSSP